ncbi:bifunctional DNA primase/polymerase-like protein [Primorskyibacter sedentarius]|uniref:Bifunctional DNA primase/polymerase-like protein n=1 Tax=Primorskyibacter sedentarius TaxID=745311 RepID=A0A4R3JKD1_9RHOB|nr:bifunctional DNA primase/polymerase [Primorskyibacter sedentarius]TCS66652.1 bifunctional DNA primase/polymerase-like protein [Primorskyibacter sedentarius]
MTALRASHLPDALRNEMARLKGAGHPLLPLGGGADGKAPLLRSWASPGLTLSQILAPMHRTGSQAYGVRLDGLAVIDCDCDDPDLVAQMEARFGCSPVHVKTPRGRHLYYRAAGAMPNLRGEGLPVDSKTGARSYVVGPLSCRPDGGFYEPVKGLLGKDDLPTLHAPSKPVSAPIPTGQRHVELVKEAMRMVEFVSDDKELEANLAGIRDEWCADPATMPDSELRDIAGWAWKCRLNNSVYKGRDSAFPMQRRSLDALRDKPNGADAIALLVTLEDQHGHSPGKRFPLDFAAMRSAGLLNLSVPRLRAARRLLEDVGLLRLASKHRAGSKKQTFVLTRMPASLSEAEIPLLRSRVVRGEGRGRVYSYL